MIETRTYPTRKVLKRQRKLMNQQGFRTLHEDFINNDESQGYKVTFVNGRDDPNNSDEQKERDLQFRLEKLLVRTIENDTITFNDFKMLMRLERGLKLQQSTIDRLIVVRQGGLSGIIQRIKNLFGL